MIKAFIDARALYDLKGLKLSLETLKKLKGDSFNKQALTKFYGKGLKPIINSKLFGKKIDSNLNLEFTWKEKYGENSFIPFVTTKEDLNIIHLAEEEVLFLDEESLPQLTDSNEEFDIILISEKDYKEEIEGLEGLIHMRYNINPKKIFMNYPNKQGNEISDESEFESFTDKRFLKEVGLDSNSKIEENLINTISQKYCVNMFERPSNTIELNFWFNVVKMEKPIILPKSTIIKGKQLGRKIGIPTANLDLPESLLPTFNLLPGIYSGVCFLSGSHNMPDETQFPIVASIGTNRHLGEEKVVFEILILHDFQGIEFYGSQLRVVLEHFIRPESSFWNFDMFIRAMECDVEVSRNLMINRANL